MFLAEEAEKTSNFAAFDLFVIAFTILTAIGVFRLLKAQRKNKFAIAVGTICLLTFLLIDALVVINWMGKLQELQDKLF